jgi:hypothetical protein
MTHEDLIPSKDDQRVIAFCESICPGQIPFLVSVTKCDGVSLARCFQNVQAMIQRSGGQIVYGWDISKIPKIHFEATFHAIWKSPHGEFVDVSPQESGQSHILFLPDAHRRDTGTLVPSRRFSIGDNETVERYWDLSDEINKLRKTRPPLSPEQTRRFLSLIRDYQDLRARLYAA